MTLRTRTSFAGGQGAFTLIELLVVIAIIGVLVSLLLPSLGSARSAAKGTACLAGMRSIGQAVVMYCDANKDRFPLSSHTAGAITRADAWLNSLQEYGIEPRARRCAMDPFREQRLTSYATNEHFEPLTPGIDYNPITRSPIPGGRTRAFDRLSMVPRPGATIYVFEPLGDGTADHINTHAFVTSDDVKRAIAVTRHLSSAHYLYADGHAAPSPWSVFSRTFTPARNPFNPETAR